MPIVALRNEKGSYNSLDVQARQIYIVALRNEKGSYNSLVAHTPKSRDCSTAK